MTWDQAVELLSRMHKLSESAHDLFNEYSDNPGAQNLFENM